MIEINNVSIAFKQDIVLQEVNLKFIEGNCYGLVGRNGSGKSALFKAICGFLPISKGQIMIDDNIIKKGRYIHNAGVVIESPNFISGFSAFENLKCLAEIENKIDDERIKNVLSIVGLPNDKKKYKNFSLGMKQRLRIAQAIMENPKYYILDEPFNGLDESGVKEMHDVINTLKKQDKVILLTSHDAYDIEVLCDTVYFVKDGKIYDRA